MTSIHYCVAVTQLNGFHTYGFDHPSDLVRFLADRHNPFRIVTVNRVFEVIYHHPWYLGRITSL